MKYNKLIGRLLIIVPLLALLLSADAKALLTIDFSEAISPNQIDYYWNDGLAHTPVTAGKLVSSNPQSPTEAIPAVPDVAPPCTRYHFYASDSNPATQNIGIRIWEAGSGTTGSRLENKKFTVVSPFGNPPMGTDVKPLTITYAYISAAAQKPIIYNYADSNNTTIYPTPAASRSLTVNAFQPLVGGLTVPLISGVWTISYNAAPKPDVPGTSTLQISTPTYPMNGGDNYVFSVKHQSYWGAMSDPSDPLNYIVGAGGGGGLSQISVTLNKKPGSLGLNQFAIPFTTIKYGTNTISTLEQLIAAINAESVVDDKTKANLHTIGWYDSTEQIDRGFIVTYDGSGNPSNYEAVNTPGAITDAVVPYRAYQVSVNEGPVTIIFATQ